MCEHAGRLRYESTVGAGTPFVDAVTRVVDSGDAIELIEGCFSGTLGYITAGIQSGVAMSTLIKTGMQLGYTEPDPRDDLGGVDVARKALIIARTCGWEFEFSDVTIESMYPSSLDGIPVPDFVAAMEQHDAALAKRAADAAAEGCALRYVATVSKRAISVGIKAVSLSSAIGSLQGSDNIMSCTSATYAAPRPLVVQGAGAGGVITAMGIVADIAATLH